MSAPISVAAAASPASRPAFSARRVIVESYRFLFANRRAILSALWLPVLLAALVLTVALKSYFSMLAHYLNAPAPDAGLASLTVSVVIACYFIWLLLNVVGSARLARLVEGHNVEKGFDLGGMALAARLYTAMLRYQLVVALIAAAALAAVISLARFLPGIPEEYRIVAGAAAVAVLLAVFSVRCGMLIPALAFHEKRSVLRRGWRLTSGSFWQLAAVWAVVTALPAFLLQVSGEVLTGPLVGGDGAPSLAVAASMLASNGLAILSIVVTLTLSTTLFFAATTVASCLAWRALNRGA